MTGKTSLTIHVRSALFGGRVSFYPIPWICTMLCAESLAEVQESACAWEMMAYFCLDSRRRLAEWFKWMADLIING